MAQRMSQTIGSPVIVDNRPGAAGMIGTDAAAKAAPDGCTIAIVELPHAIAPAVTAKLPYDLLRDFTPVTMIGTSPLVFFAGMDDDSKDFKTFLKTAAAASAKGAPPAIAHSGAGTVSHLAAELLASRTKIRFNMVPYRGSAPALTDLLGGQIDLMFTTAASVAPYVASGKLRALAVTSPQRSPAMPSVPTVAESGVPGYVAESWYGLYAPAGTPADVVARLNAAIRKSAASETFRKRIADEGIVVIASPPEELARYVAAEEVRWGQLVREAHITLD
jgi:tripartite-type tricarboxylate transporter receptor subunit TctC